MAKITTVKTHKSGVALGGIGSGSVELLPDGEFHFWQIANPERLTRVSGDKKVDDGEQHTGALSFWVRTESENGKVIVRKLGMKTDPEDFSHRMFAWNKSVERIDFDGKFPVCNIEYTDSALPVKTQLKAVAPFVPHESDISATPGFYLDYTFENPSSEEIKVSLLGTLRPSFANSDTENSFSLIQKDDMTGVFMYPSENSDSPDNGSVCLSVSGEGEKSYILSDFKKYISEYIAWSENYGVSQESILFSFREKGILPNIGTGKKPEKIPENTEKLSDDDTEMIFNIYSEYSFVVSLLERIRHTNPAFPETIAEKKDFLSFISMQTDRMDNDYGSSALCSQLTLSPGERKTVRFVLTWYFPNHFTEDGKKLGHYYENLFATAKEANVFLVEKADRIFDKASDFSDFLFNTSAPSYYPDSWSSHLSTIVKSSWYLKDGKFGLWEGLGYCGFHTTDITYHASFGLLALFPDLQKKQMKMGAEFQREDGRVHHFFTPDLEHVDNGFDRVDMNMQFVLMVLRDYLYTGDKEYFDSLYGNVCRAMDSIQSLDKDGDALPDYDTKRNTYDAWNFAGTPAYISVLWLSALNAATKIAEKQSDEKRSHKWAALLEKGKASLEERLWNGEYYNLWKNDEQTDECLMTDQLDGEWFLRATGLEGNFTDARVRDVLTLIFRENFDEEAGLVNASCPDGKRTGLFTHKNCQAEAVWTGIGYVFASLAITAGMKDTADVIVETIHNNQMRLGYFWDHWECGHHYTRPMASWTTLNALLGLSVDSKNRILCLSPTEGNSILPLCTCDFLATVVFNENTCTLKTLKGNAESWNIILPEGMTLTITK